MSQIDWPGLMRAGLHGLGLSPAEFWRLTPAELRILMGIDAAAAPMTRARLDELVRAFDAKHGEKRDGGSGGPGGRDRSA